MKGKIRTISTSQGSIKKRLNSGLEAWPGMHKARRWRSAPISMRNWETIPVTNQKIKGIERDGRVKEVVKKRITVGWGSRSINVSNLVGPPLEAKCGC